MSKELDGWSGFWSLPGVEENVPGTLRFGDDQVLKLEVSGAKRRTHPLLDEGDHNVIHGVTTNTKRVTLVEAQGFGYSMSSVGTVTYTYYLNHAIVGEHIGSKEPPRFHKISVRLDYLEDWLGERPFDTPHLTGQDGDPTKFTVTHKLPRALCATIGNDVRVEIVHGLAQNHATPWDLRLSHEARLVIEVTAPLELWDFYMHLVNPIRELVTLGVGRNSMPSAIHAFTCEAMHDLPERRIVVPLEVHSPRYTHRSSVRRPAKTKSSDWVHSALMLLPASSFVDKFETRLRQWFIARERYDAVFELLFAALSASSMYLENEFLGMAQAAETFHRRKYAGTYLNSVETADLVKAVQGVIPLSFPKEIQEKMKQKLGHLHEYTLHDRLEELVELYKPILSHLDPSFDKLKFIAAVKNTRNYLTHRSSELERKSKAGADLIHLTQRLRSLIVMCLLNEIGITVEPSFSWVERIKRFEARA